ncbi:MAG: TIM barrel protein [Salinisphaera sp.]|uniref:hydroxypyruvate isomerase family protein n=1 Tax=Salinisphaera sp. TaxID=1914330 RepID=UPI003C7C8EB6
MSDQYQFSANTGFLWPDRPFIDRVRAAAAAGFDAVEFHDEAQSADTAELVDVLSSARLPVLGLNVRMGATAGCAAIPERVDEARRDIDQAIAVADRVGARGVHVLAGKTDAPGAEAAYIATLRYALSVSDLTILIEPICRQAMPDYFLGRLDQAQRILGEIDHPRLKLLFDCYHVQTEHGDVVARLKQCVDDVGHIQIASVPGRNEPELGPVAELDYATVLAAFRDAGYAGMFGCEYRPTDAGLRWRNELRE